MTMLNRSRTLALSVMTGLYGAVAAPGQQFDADLYTGSASRIATGIVGDFDLSWNTVDGGGETFSEGGGYELGGTIGQHDAGGLGLRGGGYALTGGLWAGVCVCSADLNADCEIAATDLAMLLGDWGLCPDCTSDLDGNGETGAFDLALLLGAWGPCP